MNAPRPLEEWERDYIVKRHTEGASVRVIARELSRGHATVSRTLQAAGATTDTAQTAAATEVRLQRINAEKVDRTEALLAHADEVLRSAWDDVREMVNTTAGPMWVEREPNAREIKTAFDAAAKLIDTADKTVAGINIHNGSNKSMVEELRQGIRAIAAQVKGEKPPGDDG